MRILIVDDSRAMRAIVRRHLAQAGFGDAEIEEAEDGKQALDQIAASRPDVVLSDWNMPVMTGIELLEHLRGQGDDIPFACPFDPLANRPFRHAYRFSNIHLPPACLQQLPGSQSSPF